MPVGSLAAVALALYRKYRPAKFAEVVGQEHVTEPLSTALAAGRINHAYLFSGPRGCGKTSSARILARSLNCERGPTPEPCGNCSSCISLAPGGPGNIDVTELDAASHGGVDDTRELRDRAFFAPAESRYRVFIVDEAHMITTQGFNALLKIVEEPPEHLVFVFATTEPDKVLPTIRSRTHHYPFRLIPPGTLRKLLERICAEERAVVAPAVYPLVIRAGGGSARDSLSVLDQLLAGAGPEGVVYERAVALLGVTDVSLIDDVVDALAAGDRAAVFEAVDRMVEAGHDPRRFASDLLQRLRDLTLLQAVPEAATRGLVDAADDEIVRMIEQADRLGSGTLTRYGEIVHNGLIEMRGATAPRLLLELLCARMLLPAATVAEPGLLERLERLERRNAIAPAPLPADETVAPAASADLEVEQAGPRRSFERPSGRAPLRDADGDTGPDGTASVAGAGPTVGAAATDGGSAGAGAPAAGRTGAERGAGTGRCPGRRRVLVPPSARAPPTPTTTARRSSGGADTSARAEAARGGAHSGDEMTAAGEGQTVVAGRDGDEGRPGGEGRVDTSGRSGGDGQGGGETAPHGHAARSWRGTDSAAADGEDRPMTGGRRDPSTTSDPAARPGAARSGGDDTGSTPARSAPTAIGEPAAEPDTGTSDPPGSAAEPIAAGAAPNAGLDAAAVRRVWPEILAAAKERKKRTAALLVSATVRAIENDTLVLSIGTAPLARLLSEQSNTEVIAQSLHAVLGVSWRIRCEHGDPVSGGDTTPVRGGGPSQPPAAAPPRRPSRPPPTRRSTAPDNGEPLPPEPPDEEAPPDDEEAMLAEAAAGASSAPAERRDPEEAAIELLSAQLGARAIDRS